MVIYTPTGYVTASNLGGGGTGGRGRAGAQPNAGQRADGDAPPPGHGWEAIDSEFVPRDSKGSSGANPLAFPGVSHRVFEVSFPTTTYKAGPAITDAGPRVNHFQNFIDCVRSRKREDLHCEILEGHMSTALGHLANISFRTGRKLTFDPATETIQGDKEANAMLTRKYRDPFVVTEKV
jgi:hypothetical protein